MSYEIATERIDLFAPNTHIAMSVLVKGCISQEALIEAIKITCNRNEMLCSKIVIEDSGKAFYERISSPNQSVILYEHRKEHDWVSIIKEQESIPFDIFHGEMMRFFILNEEEHFRLLLIGHHLVGDGIAFTYIIEDIMLALSGKIELIMKPIELFTSKTLPKKYQLSLLLRLMIRFYNKKWKKSGRIFNQEDYDVIYKHYWDTRSTDIYLYNVSEDDYRIMREKAKEYKVSINTMLVTAMLKAFQEKASVGMAVSIRPQGFKGIANYASGLSIDYGYNKHATFRENASKIHQLIRKKLKEERKYFLLEFLEALEPTLIDATYFAAFADYKNKLALKACKMFGYCGRPKEISITNLTKVEIPMEYGEVCIEDFWFIPPLVSNAKRLFGVATLGNQMNITFHAENSKEIESIKEFFDLAMKELHHMEG